MILASAAGLARHARTTLLGAQDPQRAEQGPQSRPGRRHSRPAPVHQRYHRPAARRFAGRWGETQPKALACLRIDLDDLPTCFRRTTPAERKAVLITNAIDRRFREVRRRTRPIGMFQAKTAMNRILFAVVMHENHSQRVATPSALTHDS